MKIIRLRIDGHLFYLDPEQDVDALKEQVLTAARGVAEFLVFTPIGHGEVSVLMAPTTPVRFEVQERTEEEVASWEENPPSADFELYPEM